MGVADQFNRGFSQGVELFRLRQEAQEKKRKREEEEKLKASLAQAYESNPDLAPEDAGKVEAFQDYNANLADQDASTFGVKYDPASYANHNAPKTQTDVTVARNMSIAKALGASGDYRGAMAAEQAANQARTQERELVRQDRRDVLAERRDNQLLQQGDLSINKMMEEEKRANGIKAFDAEVGEMYSAGAKPDSKAILGLAAKHGVGTEYAANLYLKQVGVSKQDALNLVDEKLATLKDAAANGLPALLDLADPDPSDGKKPEVMKNKDGTIALMYGGKPMPGFERLPAENTAGVIYKQLEGIYKGDPFAAAAVIADQKMQELKRQEVESKIVENRAQAGASNASAAASMATVGAKKQADADKKAAQDAAVNLARERNPGLTKAQEAAIRTGVLNVFKDAAKNEYTSSIDDLGGTITRLNKDTGDIDIINAKSGELIKSVPGPGKQAQAVAKPGVGPKVGERRTINGVPAVWDGKGWKRAQ